MKQFIIILLAAMAAIPASADDTTTRRERNFIVEGNKLYHAERYADAEVAYRKALQENAMNEIAQFNLAASLLRQGSASAETQKEASGILQNLTRDAQNVSIAEKSFYNLGNIAFNAQDYAKSIELYKNALRRNPDNDQARENLRLAQKRLEEQQNQNQDQNKDDQNKDQDKEQDKQEQNKQDQNQDQNQNQNQDQNKDDKQDQQQQQNQPQDQKQQPQNQQQGGISKLNADKILKAMENEENATRARINAEKKKNGAPTRRPVTNPW